MYKKIFKSMCVLSMLTMLISAVLIMSACYTSFNTRYVQELKSQTAIIASQAEYDHSENILEQICEYNPDKSFALIDASGNIVYANSSDSDGYGPQPYVLTHISDARRDGSAQWHTYTLLPFRHIYYYAYALDNDYVLCIYAVADGMNSMFYAVLLAVIFVSVLLYLLSVRVAGALTESIVNPIKNIRLDTEFDTDTVYEEIKPLISRLVRQNTEISRQIEKAKTHKVRLQAIADNMNDGLVILDADGNVMSVNECALEIFGKSESDIKYRDASRLTFNGDILDCITKSLDGKKTNVTVYLDDKTYQIFCSATQHDNRVTGAVMLLFDVSETARAEGIRREFTANVSHELKTPLTSIHGYAQIINSGIAKPDDVGGFVAKIEKESSRLITLINDIINLSKLDEGGDEQDKQHVCVKDIVEDVVEQLLQKAMARDITVSMNCEEYMVYINPVQLTQLVYNLCDNAIKYNRDGGTVNIVAKNGVLTIEDTGIGISGEYIDRIFERFFRVDKSRSKKVDGTGLGLSIVKHIAQKNNIEISVNSVVDVGTKFVVEFGNIL